ncbi:MAG: 1-deoxy-D-xylulose-5-phosphate reductoisomerase [Clostridia bacterium]|nr:1-deoxy-D-xylulose-5-phosphate reductoisomerase [Clostridia bacterium]
MKSLTILGSTGSIGTQALDVAKLCGFRIKALTANSRTDIIERQIREFAPEKVALADEKAAADLKVRVSDTATKVLSGREGVNECAFCGSDTVLNSIVGIAGLEPTLCAIKAGSKIALANKETLVAGGKLVIDTARENKVDILPVDSEHSAIFQSLQGCRDRKQIKKLILTASGGPFFGKTPEELETVTLEQALNHPNWSMGAKITVDSATMMNKGLELIEAAWLFDMSPDYIDIVVHRQSVVHSLVEYIDNSVIAQLGVPDMRIPIQYALTYPDRCVSSVRELKLWEYGTLTFEQPDYETFKCLKYAGEALRRGGVYPAALNAANEKANELFRNGKIRFTDIPYAVGASLEKTRNTGSYTFEDITETDKCVRSETEDLFA